MAADGKTPPQPTHRGGAATLCVYVVSLFAYTIKMTYLPCVHTYIHTYKQTDRQTDIQPYIHKSIQTYSYTYTWLHMCDPYPLGGGVGGARGGCIIYTIPKYPMGTWLGTRLWFFPPAISWQRHGLGGLMDEILHHLGWLKHVKTL